MYQVKDFWAEVPLRGKWEQWVNIPRFLDCCRSCPNFGQVWSCPPYSFDPLSIWNSYDTVQICCRQICFNDEALQIAYPPQELGQISKELLQREQDALLEKMMELERQNRGSMALAAGSCAACAPMDCSRKTGGCCRHPEKIRYSLESLGADVGRIVEEQFGLKMLWGQEGHLPEYYLLVAGILKNQ